MSGREAAGLNQHRKANVFPLFPEQASTNAPQVDRLFAVLVLVAIFFSLLIFISVAYFAIRYRKGSPASRKNASVQNIRLEVAWTVIPFCMTMGLFFWASKVYIDQRIAPPNAMEVYVLAKQWMWKIQHQRGNREINELHVPIGEPVKLIMTSQDVVHSFFIPAFRVKQDVLPGRYTTEWFEATKIGEFPFLCAQYCGTSHAIMTGKVIVMKPEDFERWLSGTATGATMSSAGGDLFQQFGCATCHQPGNTGRGPSLVGVFGSTVKLEGGKTVLADQDYVRESILDPTAKIVAGYKPIMPTFKNQVSPDQLSQLIEYVKSLGGPGQTAKGGGK